MFNSAPKYASKSSYVRDNGCHKKIMVEHLLL